MGCSYLEAKLTACQTPGTSYTLPAITSVADWLKCSHRPWRAVSPRWRHGPVSRDTAPSYIMPTVSSGYTRTHWLPGLDPSEQPDKLFLRQALNDSMNDVGLTRREGARLWFCVKVYTTNCNIVILMAAESPGDQTLSNRQQTQNIYISVAQMYRHRWLNRARIGYVRLCI